MSTNPNSSLSTRCVHAGEAGDALGSPFTPLYSSTTFRYASMAELMAVAQGERPGALYTRYGLNPSIQSLERKLAALDVAESALAFGAGMAAISATALAHGQNGIVVLGEVYGGSLECFDALNELGLPLTVLDLDDWAGLENALTDGAGLVFLESPANPTLTIADIGTVAAETRRHGALLAVDNTFATPVNQQPLALGADLVLQSATKFLGGHSDVTAGVVTGAEQVIAPLRRWRRCLGQTIAPDIAHRLARELATLPLRVARQNATAHYLAERLQGHSAVRRVLYPGLPDFPGHGVAVRQMIGFGGMLSLELATDLTGTVTVADRLQLIARAPSLGGVESLITLPALTSHRELSPAERERRGISDGLIRLSIGLEDADELLADLHQALAAVA